MTAATEFLTKGHLRLGRLRRWVICAFRRRFWLRPSWLWLSPAPPARSRCNPPRRRPRAATAAAEPARIARRIRITFHSGTSRRPFAHSDRESRRVRCRFAETRQPVDSAIDMPSKGRSSREQTQKPRRGMPSRSGPLPCRFHVHFAGTCNF
jgi:hypothetical protein